MGGFYNWFRLFVDRAFVGVCRVSEACAQVLIVLYSFEQPYGGGRVPRKLLDRNRGIQL